MTCPGVILNPGSNKLLGQHVNRKCEGKAVVFFRYCAVEKCHWRLSARKHVASRRVLQGCFFHCPVKALSHEITIAYKRKFSWPYPEFSVADPGCLSRIRLFSIPDPGSELFLSRIPDFNPKKLFLSFMKHDPGCSSRIPDPDPDFLPFPDPGSRGQKGTGSGIRIRHTSCILRFRAMSDWRWEIGPSPR
jgi:hypothetical protein